MALRKTIELEGKSIIQTAVGAVEAGNQSVSFSAYIKIVSISGDKNEITANLHFASDSCSFSKQYQVPVSVETGALNFIEQAYKHLKTLPEFAGAVDC